MPNTTKERIDFYEQETGDFLMEHWPSNSYLVYGVSTRMGPAWFLQDGEKVGHKPGSWMNPADTYLVQTSI
jgi:hypothetical protein